MTSPPVQHSDARARQLAEEFIAAPGAPVPVGGGRLLPRLAIRCMALRSICRHILPPPQVTGFYYGSGAVYQCYPGFAMRRVHS